MHWRTVHEFRHEDRTMLVKRPEGDSDTGQQFVLVHGIGVSSRYYTRLARVLANTGGVHVVELPGFGGAPRPDTPLSVEDHAATLNAYVRQAGLDRPVLVGHSMGVQVVVEAALQEPALYPCVVGIGGVVDPSARTAWRQAARLGLDTLREPPLANYAVLRDYVRTGPRWYLRTLPIMLGYRLEEALPRLRAPLLLLRGTRDPIATQSWAEQMQRLAPDARLVTLDRAAHVAMYSRPDDVAEEILAQARVAAGPLSP
ncbi:alpha/beta fold hydrolase [Ornithinimicrobium pratense]|uniref:Alpha/beta hydrolase n=1 Tax=Ornithinimicrobium pratense TaxID=2593973 RepID=A0A5J6V4D4_9MICO|nr:alpha/beta hydrolase [Ornithinimicrobium pratense]QFG68615.1 alpha/beta hydrolase [Ornithinimicrobium pratense]